MAEATARASAPVITGNPLLQVRELHAWYDESHVLHGVDFDVRPGEVVTLLGRNGAGKTTTLKSVMGIVGKRRGSVRFGAAELIGMPSNRIARLGLAFCPEERGIFASLSVEENLLLPPVVAPGGLTMEAVFGLFPNLRERRRSQGTKLSGGEQQMLAIGRILRTGARLLLLDEPTEGLAPVIVQQIGATIRRLKREELHHPARRAELPLRRHRGRPALRDGAWARRGHDRQCRARPPHGQAARLPRGMIRHLSPFTWTTSHPERTTNHDVDAQCDRRPRPLAGQRGRGGADLRRDHQDRRAERPVEPLRGPHRAGLGGGGADGGGRFWRGGQGHEGRDHLRRPSEQGRRRIEYRAAVVRLGQGGRHRRRAELGRGPCREPDHAGQGQGLSWCRARRPRT